MSAGPQDSAERPLATRAMLDALIALLPLPVATFDSQLRLTNANAAFARITGLAPATAVGTRLRDAFPTALSDTDWLIDESSVGAGRSGRVAFLVGGGARMMDVTLAPLQSTDAGLTLVFLATDVTDEQRAVASEARARERRLAAVGQLAAGVMHDVNNALNPIVAAAYLLDVHADDPVAVRDYARRIAMAAETGAATAARVGRFLRQEPLEGSREELVDLDIVADEVVAMTRPVWAERMHSGGIELARRRGGDALTRGIAGEVREALMNLVQNALDAMPTGGTLGVVTGGAADQVWIEVRDSGPGMTAEARERAFEPFYSTKGRKGTGLGLAEVYGIMKRHRGQAEVRATGASGTVVRLTFPRATTLLRTEHAPPGTPLPRRVLIVEDHEDGREFMRALLASDGHSVAVAATVADAIDTLRATEAPFHVLVVDIGLPDGNGWDLVRRAREICSDLRVGVVTGWEPTGKPPVPVEFTLRKPVPAQALLRHVAGTPSQQ